MNSQQFNLPENICRFDPCNERVEKCGFCNSHFLYNLKVQEAEKNFSEWRPKSIGEQYFKNKIEELEYRYSNRKTWMRRRSKSKLS